MDINQKLNEINFESDVLTEDNVSNVLIDDSQKLVTGHGIFEALSKIKPVDNILSDFNVLSSMQQEDIIYCLSCIVQRFGGNKNTTIDIGRLPIRHVGKEGIDFNVNGNHVSLQIKDGELVQSKKLVSGTSDKILLADLSKNSDVYEMYLSDSQLYTTQVYSFDPADVNQYIDIQDASTSLKCKLCIINGVLSKITL